MHEDLQRLSYSPEIHAKLSSTLSHNDTMGCRWVSE